MSIPKVMIVTGGSRGIGAGVARMAGARGFDVAVNYTSAADAAESVCAEIVAAGGKAIAIQANVGDPQDVANMFTKAEEALGPVGYLINNAGISTMSPIAEFPIETVQRIVETNLLGTIYCTREAAGRMSTARGGKGGVIINVSSISAVHGGMKHDTIYAATKGGQDSFTRGVAKEVAQEGIRVCGMRPGITRTEIWDTQYTPEEVRDFGRNAIPIGRLGEVEDMAQAILWLCSDEASYITGEILNVSGAREIFIPT